MLRRRKISRRRKSTDTRFFPHFHEGHQDLATSQHIDMILNQNIATAFQNMAL